MIVLRATTDAIKVQATTTGSAIDCHVSAMEADNAVPPVIQDIVRVNTASIVDTTLTTILDCTTANRRRNVKKISIFNTHATVATVIEVTHTDGTTIETLAKVNLLVGELLLFTQGGHWVHYDSNGGVYPSVGNKASQAEVEAATADDKYLTPLSVNWHPGVCKCWGKAVGAGTSLTVNWNTAGIVDTGTGRLGVTIGTDFSSANYAISANLERTVTSLTATGVEDHAIRNASPAAGTFEIESYDQTAILFAAQDPQNYFWQCHGDQ